MRTHYPMHPYVHELADRQGMLIWSEIPVYAVKTLYLKRESVRALAAKEMRRNVETNLNHPSVMLWSVGNELSSRPGPVAGRLHPPRGRDRQGHRPDAPDVGSPSPATRRRAARPSTRRSTSSASTSTSAGTPARAGSCSTAPGSAPYLDQVRALLPDSRRSWSREFGAEANREGPVEEKGTWAFQQDFVNYHLGVFASKPWLSGAVYWALNEFRVKPGLGGRQPAPAAARAPEGPADLRHDVAQARLGRRPAVLQRHGPVPVAGALSASARARGAARGRARRRRPALRAAAAGRRAARGRAGARAPARRRAAGCRRTARSSGVPEMRSLPPPPPPSSSSGPSPPSAVSERRNITNSSTPRARATRCSAPKMSISSSSGDITEIYPS